MAYFEPYIDESGLHIPSYSDTRNDIVESFRSVYGADFYLEPDSQDYEMVSVLSKKIFDSYSALLLAYNNRSPATATGAGLSGIVMVNGITRKPSGHSFADVIVEGTAGTLIDGKIVADQNNVQWALETVTIGANGTATSVAKCKQAGSITAKANTITKIMTPIAGWKSVTNPNDAIVADPVESDAQLRARQKISVARPSRTVLLGLMGGIAELKDVTRYKLYENDTNIEGFYGPPIPGHSICVVVEGGNDDEIAQEIYLRKTPGCGTFGDISIAVLSEMNDNPVESPPVKFFRPSYVDIFVKITLTPLAGYTTQYTENIKQSVAEYLNSVEIGLDLMVSALYSPVWKTTPDITDPVFYIQSIQIGKSQSDLKTENIDISFKEVARGKVENIEVEVVE